MGKKLRNVTTKDGSTIKFGSGGRVTYDQKDGITLHHKPGLLGRLLGKNPEKMYERLTNGGRDVASIDE